MGNTILAVLDDIDAGLKADLATRSNAISSAIRPRGGVMLFAVNGNAR